MPFTDVEIAHRESVLMTKYYPEFSEGEIQALRDGIVLASVHQQIEGMLRDPTVHRVDVEPPVKRANRRKRSTEIRGYAERPRVESPR